jgi:transposase
MSQFQEMLKSANVNCTSEINRWFLDVVVQKDIPAKTEYQNVIAIDMGIKHIATSVELATNRTVF